jgi:hypothetical protein
MTTLVQQEIGIRTDRSPGAYFLYPRINQPSVFRRCSDLHFAGCLTLMNIQPLYGSSAADIAIIGFMENAEYCLAKGEFSSKGR